MSVGFPQPLPGHSAGCWVSIRLGTALVWGPHMALQGPWPAVWGTAHGPPRPGRGPRVVLAGGSQGREAREELFMFAGAKCSPGTAPAVPGPNYSTRSSPPTHRRPGTKRGQRRQAGHHAPQPSQQPPFPKLHMTSSGQEGPGILASLAPMGPGGQEELLPRRTPPGPCAGTAPSTWLLPSWGVVGIPNVGPGCSKWGSWVF